MADIKSGSNRIIKEYRLLKNSRHRKEKDKIILEGAILLKEALRAGLQLDCVLYTSSFGWEPGGKEVLSQAWYVIGEKKVLQIEQNLFDSIAQTENPQGVAAIARPPRHTLSFLERENVFFVILDEVQDPGNLGTIIRCAAAAGADGAVLLPGSVDPYNPKALRAGMGGTFFLPVVKAGENFFDGGHLPPGTRVVAACPEGELPYFKVNFLGPAAVIIGNESRGIGQKWLDRAEVKAYIPLKGAIASINAAAAAAVFIFEAVRQRENAAE